MKRIAIMVLILVFIPVAVFAMKADIGGEVQLSSYVYDEHQDYKQGYGEGELLLPVTLTFPEHPSWSIVAEPRIRFDSQELATGTDHPHKRDRSIVDIEEGYIEYLRNKWEIRAGYQITDWSVTDTVSSSDNLNPLDLSLIPEWERRSVPMATLRYGYDTYAEVAVKPFFSPTILPEYRWKKETSGISLTESREEEDDPQIGLRLGTIWQGADLQLSFYHGYANNPYGKVIERTLRGMKVQPRFSEEDVVSLGVVRDLPLWGILGRLDVGYFHQDHGDNFFQYVVGVEKNWQNVASSGDRIFTLLQFCGEEVTNEDEEVIELTDFRRVFKDFLIGKAHYQFGRGSPWKIKFRGSYNLEEGDSFLEPALQWSKRSWQVEAGLQVVSGPKDTFWGQYGNNDCFFTKLTFKF